MHVETTSITTFVLLHMCVCRDNECVGEREDVETMRISTRCLVVHVCMYRQHISQDFELSMQRQGAPR